MKKLNRETNTVYSIYTKVWNNYILKGPQYLYFTKKFIVRHLDAHHNVMLFDAL